MDILYYYYCIKLHFFRCSQFCVYPEKALTEQNNMYLCIYLPIEIYIECMSFDSNLNIKED